MRNAGKRCARRGTNYMKTPKSYVLVPLVIQSLMSGCVAAFASGDDIVLKYTDGTSERATCPEEAAMIRNYSLYQNGKLKDCAEPNFFNIVSAVQAKRPATVSA